MIINNSDLLKFELLEFKLSETEFSKFNSRAPKYYTMHA